MSEVGAALALYFLSVVRAGVASERKKTRLDDTRAPPWLVALQDKLRAALPETQHDPLLRDLALGRPDWPLDAPQWRRVEYRVRASILHTFMSSPPDADPYTDKDKGIPSFAKQAFDLCMRVADGGEATGSERHSIALAAYEAGRPGGGRTTVSRYFAGAARRAVSEDADTVARMAYYVARMMYLQYPGGAGASCASWEQVVQERRVAQRDAWGEAVEAAIWAIEWEQAREPEPEPDK